MDKSTGRHGLWKLGRARGRPCMKATVTEDNITLYCFNCDKFTAVLWTADQYGFVPTPDEAIDTPYKKLNWDGKVDVDFNGAPYQHSRETGRYETTRTLYVLDAPMGAGKTHAYKTYVSRHSDKIILAVTFRQSLAAYLAQILGWDCYLQPTFNWSTFKHGVVCLDSLNKIPIDRCFQEVVIDEAFFVLSHLCGDTISSKPGHLRVIFECFKRILLGANKVILMQYRMTESCINIYRDLGKRF